MSSLRHSIPHKLLGYTFQFETKVIARKLTNISINLRLHIFITNWNRLNRFMCA